MRAHRLWALALTAAGALHLAAATAAHALTACTAAQITAQDANCPAAGNCTITKLFTVADGCTLDFGTRAVTIGSSGTIDIGNGSVVLRAGSLTIAPSGIIDGRGNGTGSPANNGGYIRVETTGAVTLQRSGLNNGRIDVSARSISGTIEIDAGGPIAISGRLNADNLIPAGSGGTIRLESGTGITSATGSAISAAGGIGAFVPGGIDLRSDGNIDIAESLRAPASDGGAVEVSAAGSITLRGGANVNANGDAGSAGTISLNAGLGVQVLAPLQARGNTSETFSGGGDGGQVSIDADYGDVTIADNVNAEGADPDGAGGEIEIEALGNVTVQSPAFVSVNGNGQSSDGGAISLAAGLDFVTTGNLDVSGGASGGQLDIVAERDLHIGAILDARGRYLGGLGGNVSLEASGSVSGSLNVDGTVDAGGGGCGEDLGCGTGGTIGVLGCTIAVSALGKLDARAPNGGEIDLGSRKALTINGATTAARTVANGTEGKVVIQQLTGSSSAIGAGLVAPAPQVASLPPCPSDDECLTPCPTCGNGVVEFPEGCDTAGTPASCDGCSVFCQPEDCNDGLACSSDQCDPQLGCRNVPTPNCVEPTATATSPPGTPGTPHSTPTVTRTPTRTATVTRTFTITSTPTLTRTFTASSTPTPSATPVSTPSSFHDLVVLPVRPLQLKIDVGETSATGRVLVKVQNVDKTGGHMIRLTASDGDCPPGTVAALPDFDRLAPFSQDTVYLAHGLNGRATIAVVVQSGAFTSFNPHTPRRCRIRVEAQSTLVGNADPVPSNNVYPVEINVTDANDVPGVKAHESFVGSLRGVAVRVGRGRSSATKRFAVMAGNGDDADVGGHAIFINGALGECPPGTIISADFDQVASGMQNRAAVPTGTTRRGVLQVTVDAAGFTSTSRRSPVRCIAVVTAAGPAGDTDASNNMSLLVVDVTDRNDL